MEQNNMKEVDLKEIIKNYEAQSLDKEIIELAKEDLEYGLTEKQIDYYLDKKLSVAQMKQYSRAMRAGLSEEFIRMLKNGNFKCRQLEVIIDFHLKGVPVESMKDTITSSMEPHALNKALSAIYEKMQQAKESIPEENVEAVRIYEKIEEMLSGIGENSNFLQAVMDKLGTLDTIAQSNDDVREALSKSVEEKERIINDQQDRITQAAKENAELRKKLEEVSNSKASFENEKAHYEKELCELRTENEALRKEKEDMVRQIEDKEKELTKKNDELEEVSNRKVPNMNFDTTITDKNGVMGRVHVEQTQRKSPEGLLALAGKKLFGKQRVNLIKQLTGKGLNQQQMEQIKVAIESGLTDEEVIDIINSGFSAQEMEQAIQIVIAEKMYQ